MNRGIQYLIQLRILYLLTLHFVPNNFEENDVFRITVPLNDEFSWDAQRENVPVNVPVNERQKQILESLKRGDSFTAAQFAEKLNVTYKTIKRDLQYLTENKLIKRIGSDKSGKWEILR